MKRFTAPVMQYVPRFANGVIYRCHRGGQCRQGSESVQIPLKVLFFPGVGIHLLQTRFPLHLPRPRDAASQHHLRNADVTVVGCNVGLPISVQLDVVMTSAPVSTSQPCMAKTQSAL